jgi:hypothetical protein
MAVRNLACRIRYLITKESTEINRDILYDCHGEMKPNQPHSPPVTVRLRQMDVIENAEQTQKVRRQATT